MQQKMIVLYESKYGTTTQYANWIGEELSCPIVKTSDADIKEIILYDTIILGGGLYAGGILGGKFLNKNINQLKDKKIIVFTVGLTNPEYKESLQPIIDKSFDEDVLNNIEVFFLRGGIDYEKLSKVHKIMMSMLYKKSIKIPTEEKNQDDILFLKTYGEKIDYTEKSYILPIIDSVLDK